MRGVLRLRIIKAQRPTALTVGAGGVRLDIFLLSIISLFFFLPVSLGLSIIKMHLWMSFHLTDFNEIFFAKLEQIYQISPQNYPCIIIQSYYVYGKGFPLTERNN